jgi:hypothetical protein
MQGAFWGICGREEGVSYMRMHFRETHASESHTFVRRGFRRPRGPTKDVVLNCESGTPL